LECTQNSDYLSAVNQSAFSFVFNESYYSENGQIVDYYSYNKFLHLGSSTGYLHELPIHPNIVQYLDGSNQTFISTGDFQISQSSVPDGYYMGVWVDIDEYFTRITQTEAYMPKSTRVPAGMKTRIERENWIYKLLVIT
jgi:hypothetical protein